MAMNVEKKPTKALYLHKQWRTFVPSMLETLHPGSYPLRPKITIHPNVPGTELCSFEDQLLFAQVDDMERSILDSAIATKIREMNIKDKKPKIIIFRKGAFPNGSQEQTLCIVDNNFTNQKMRSAVKNLGELMAMAYDQILIPIPMDLDTLKSLGTSVTVPANLKICLLDHNYWDSSKTSVRIENNPTSGANCSGV